MKMLNRITTAIIIILLAAGCVFGMKYINTLKGMIPTNNKITSTAD